MGFRKFVKSRQHLFFLGNLSSEVLEDLGGRTAGSVPTAEIIICVPRPMGGGNTKKLSETDSPRTASKVDAPTAPWYNEAKASSFS